MTKSSFEKALEKYQRDVNRTVKRQIVENKRLADRNKREVVKQARIDARIERASSIVGGQPQVGSMRILDASSEELVNLICNGYCRNDFCVTNHEVLIPSYLEKDLSLEFEKLKQYGLISDYGCYIDGSWEINILPSLLSYFERKECAFMQEKESYNTNNFYGDVTEVQIQQGTINSSQVQTITKNLDYEEVAEIVGRIKKYDSLLDGEFGENASELKERLVALEELIQKREHLGKIKSLLAEIKNLAIGVTGSLIASGIAAQIPTF